MKPEPVKVDHTGGHAPSEQRKEVRRATWKDLAAIVWGLTWVGWVTASSQDLFQTQEVLLAHGARLPEILPAPELCELEGNDLQEEQCVWICPVSARRDASSGVWVPSPQQTRN